MKNLRILAALILVLAVFPFFSCAGKKAPAMPDNTQCAPLAQAGLKLGVFVAPFSGAVPDGSKNGEAFYALLKEKIAKQTMGIRFTPDSALEANARKQEIGPTGCVNPLALLEDAAARGVAAVVIGCFEDPESAVEKRGLYGFREEICVTSLHLRVWVYETRTLTKILDTSLEEKLSGADAPKNADQCLAIVSEKLSKVAADAVATALEDIPFTAFITESGPAGVTIAAGSESGLVEGACLVVYGPGKVLVGSGENAYCVPGPLVGRVRLTRVSEGKSFAELVYGEAPTSSWVGLE